jgi:hypothetical protein
MRASGRFCPSRPTLRLGHLRTRNMAIAPVILCGRWYQTLTLRCPARPVPRRVREGVGPFLSFEAHASRGAPQDEEYGNRTGHLVWPLGLYQRSDDLTCRQYTRPSTLDPHPEVPGKAGPRRVRAGVGPVLSFEAHASLGAPQDEEYGNRTGHLVWPLVSDPPQDLSKILSKPRFLQSKPLHSGQARCPGLLPAPPAKP